MTLMLSSPDQLTDYSFSPQEDNISLSPVSYSDTDHTYSSYGSKKIPLLPEDSLERQLQEHPTLYAAVRTFTETMIPYGKYMFQDNRIDFEEMSTQDQVNDLLWQALGAAFYAVGMNYKAVTRGVDTFLFNKIPVARASGKVFEGVGGGFKVAGLGGMLDPARGLGAMLKELGAGKALIPIGGAISSLGFSKQVVMGALDDINHFRFRQGPMRVIDSVGLTSKKTMNTVEDFDWFRSGYDFNDAVRVQLKSVQKTLKGLDTDNIPLGKKTIRVTDSPNMSKEEYKALKGELTGEKNALTNHFHTEISKKDPVITSAFKKLTQPSNDSNIIKISDEFAHSLTNQEEILKTYFGGKLSKRISDIGGNTLDQTNAVVREVGKKYMPYIEAEKLSIENMNADQFSTFLDYLTLGDKWKHIERKVFGTKFLAGASPVRDVTMEGEALFKTHSHGYEPTRKALSKTKTYELEKKMTLQQMLVDEKLGLLSENVKGIKKFSKKEGYLTQETQDKVFSVMKLADDTMTKLRIVLEKDLKINKLDSPVVQKQKTAAREKFLEDTQEKLYHEAKQTLEGDIGGIGLLDTTKKFFDKLYAEDFFYDVSKLLTRLPMSKVGKQEVGALIDDMTNNLDSAFKKKNNFTGVEKRNVVKNIAKNIQDKIAASHAFDEKTGKLISQNPWFEGNQKDIMGLLDEFNFKHYNAKKGLTSYLEDYFPRYGAEQKTIKDIFSPLTQNKNKLEFYENARKASIEYDGVSDFETLVLARIKKQAKKMHFNEPMQEVANYAGKLPTMWREYFEHFIAREMGLPSKADDTVAKFINSLQIEGLTTDAYAIRHTARTINNLTHMSLLGLKAGAGIRNVFQPLLTVPTDLGGVRTIGDLAQGYKDVVKSGLALREATKKGVPLAKNQFNLMKYIDDIGGISEFAPETSYVGNLFGKKTVRDELSAIKKVLHNTNNPGKAFMKLGESETIRDSFLVFMKYSDKLNRYATGGAAYNRWNNVLGKYGVDDTQNITKEMLRMRRKPIRDEIVGLLKKKDPQSINAARDVFVKDVISDTQFLYTTLDAPLITQSAGAAGRLTLIFNSWWMNYQSLIRKWMSDPKTVDEKARNAITWMTTGAMVEQALEPMFGESTAQRSTGIGPVLITDFDAVRRVPLFGGAINIVSSLSDGRYGDAALTLLNGLPGGYVAKRTMTETMDEGLSGFLKSMGQFRSDKNYTPGRGLVNSLPFIEMK